MTRYILVGGYSRKASDGGKGFAEELVKGFMEPVKILDCLFARSKESWRADYADDKEFFATHLPDTKLEFKLADPEKFKEQVVWADAIYLRGGDTALLLKLLSQSKGWEKELEGKTLAGSSAGACAISQNYYELDTLGVSEGLGLASVKVIVHYRSDYNAPNIDWNKAYHELTDYNDQTLPLLTLKEGEYTVIAK